MSRRKWLALILILAGLASNFLILSREISSEYEPCTLYYTILDHQSGTYQVFYAPDTNFTEEQTVFAAYDGGDMPRTVSCQIPCTTNFLRFDINQCVTEAQLSDVYVVYRKKQVAVPAELFLNSINRNMVASVQAEGQTLSIRTSGDDAYISIDIQALGLQDIADAYTRKSEGAKSIILCLILDFGLFYLYRHASQLKDIVKETYRNREMILRLAKNDFMVKFAGSYFGMIWAFVQPMVTVLLYWFVFQMGFKSGSVGETPFVLWLIAGLVPWFYFSDVVSTGAGSLIEYSYLVKKVVFDVSILPVVKVISALFVHAFFLGVTVIIFALYGYYPDWYTLQLAYYLMCMVLLSLGITYITSALMVFFRDLGQLIGIFLQVGMWMTPIMWQYTMLPQSLQTLLKLNPVYYIITGYRDCVINKIPVWGHSTWTMYFWFFTIALLMVGMKLFNRLKVHFADVL